ncbi:MAG: sugar transferase, partial [Tetragenococcus halophilus]|nr:sugar transferase [Tetragenococcus halophilus]
MYAKYLKRWIDFFLSFLAIILLSPIMLLLAILVRFKLGSPILFKQKRPGFKEEIFEIYKFRSMTDKRDAKGDLLSDDQRLTRFGKVLRSTSLDELPSLFNIVKGDMSIVGPRPLLVEYLDLYDEEQKKRHDVRPGLTGLAQIGGRNQISWTERLKLDLEYIQNIRFTLDL